MQSIDNRFPKLFIFILFGLIISTLIHKSVALEKKEISWRDSKDYSRYCYDKEQNANVNPTKCYETYLEYCKNNNKKVIIIVGSGSFYINNYSDKTLPYFFIDMGGNYLPDVIGKVENLDNLKLVLGKADIVIFENIDVDKLTPQAYMVALNLLKKEGKLISSGIPTFFIHQEKDLDDMKSSFMTGAFVISLYMSKKSILPFTLGKGNIFRGFDFKNEFKKGIVSDDVIFITENIAGLKNFIKMYLLQNNTPENIEILEFEKHTPSAEEWPHKDRVGYFFKITK